MSRIRITGGEWRSRLIQVADGPGLRPTPDRVRETLFNWLGQDLAGLAVLDAFAGSGILGFEAASRGAARVVMLERERGPFLALKKHADGFACPRLEPLCGDALKFAPFGTENQFDLVFLDPPYRQGLLERVVPCLPRWTRTGARLYVEAEAPVERLGNWQTVKSGRAGQVFYHLLEQS
jgi:16S rRNA (guanine966-N2)-methyltransferase